jgi:ASC-1-like (ASCH) protein
MPPTTIVLSSPWFGFVACGLKTVELCPADGACSRLCSGDYVNFENKATGLCVRRRVDKVLRHAGTVAALETCGLERALPHCTDLATGAAFYRRTMGGRGAGVVAVYLSPFRGPGKAGDMF